MIYFDTSVLIASFVEDHPNFEKSFYWLEKVITGKEQGLISSHTLADLYSVLTALPVKPKIDPIIVNKYIKENIKKNFNMELKTFFNDIPRRQKNY